LDRSAVLNRFKMFYSDLTRSELAELDGIYAEHVVFRDPIHQVDGRAALFHYIEDLCSNIQSCQFKYLDEMISNGNAYIKWDMIFRHPKLDGGRVVTVRGVSQLSFDESGIYFHEDFYDLGAMLYEHVPVFGFGVRWLKRRLATVS